jgi:hypothetical protein
MVCEGESVGDAVSVGVGFAPNLNSYPTVSQSTTVTAICKNPTDRAQLSAVKKLRLSAQKKQLERDRIEKTHIWAALGFALAVVSAIVIYDMAQPEKEISVP